MARNKCRNDQDWVLGAPIKTRLFELWFGAATSETPPHTARELENLIGAKGPNALVKTLPHLLSMGLIRQDGKTYQPVPLSELPPDLQAIRRALEALLKALAQL
jgi:hypothetical protein